MAKRIYRVSDGVSDRLVEAISKAHAISFIVDATFSARVPTQQELINMIKAGRQIEDAGDSKRSRKAAA
jgi:hypothetical protein